MGRLHWHELLKCTLCLHWLVILGSFVRPCFWWNISNTFCWWSCLQEPSRPTFRNIPSPQHPQSLGQAACLTLHVRDQETAPCFLVHPVLEGTTLLTRLWFPSQEVDFLPIPNRVFHKFSNQLLLHCCIRDVVLRSMDKKNRNDPGREENMGTHHVLRREYWVCSLTWSSRELHNKPWFH